MWLTLSQAKRAQQQNKIGKVFTTIQQICAKAKIEIIFMHFRYMNQYDRIVRIFKSLFQ